MQLVVTVLGIATGAAWLCALVFWVWSLAHLSGRRSLARMLFSGFEAFVADNYDERGKVLQRRFLRSAAAFALCLVLSIGTAVIAAQLGT